MDFLGMGREIERLHCLDDGNIVFTLLKPRVYFECGMKLKRILKLTFQELFSRQQVKNRHPFRFENDLQKRRQNNEIYSINSFENGEWNIIPLDGKVPDDHSFFHSE